MSREEKRSELLMELDVFVRGLRPEEARRFNDGLRRDLVERLLNGDLVALVTDLAEQQKMYDERLELLRSLQGHVDLEPRLLNNDRHIIECLDQEVRRQQGCLHAATVPPFRVTSNPRDIQLQSLVLRFLLSVIPRLPS